MNLIYAIVSIFQSIVILAAERAEETQQSNSNMKLQNIYSLDGYCKSGKCSGFRFDKASEVAFFDLQAKVRIKEGATYDLINPDENKVFVFENSTFVHFPLHFFYGLDVHELDIRNCSIQFLSWENFLMAGNLNILLLSQNNIEQIPRSVFDFASELQYLFLDDNQISTLFSDSFKNLGKLKYLHLSGNLLEQLPEAVFNPLLNLLELSLAHNKLYAINDDIFTKNPSLFTVSFKGNDLRDINENAFRAQSKLILLDISDNNHLEKLIANINVQNLIAANCSLMQVNIYGDVASVDMQDNRILELYFSKPEALEFLTLRNNSLEQIASLALATNLLSLDVSDNPHLQNLPDPWMTKSLERLNLSNTGLITIPISSLKEQTGLRNLDISHNKIRELEPIHFKYLSKLTNIYIHANDWNCYNLRMLMDLLILSNGITYTPDIFDVNFPGEYIHSISCMYRLESINSIEQLSEQSTEQAKLRDHTRLAEQLNEDASLIEVRKLREELQVVIRFYEDKIDTAFKRLNDLDARLQQFEHMNASLWKQITITV